MTSNCCSVARMTKTRLLQKSLLNNSTLLAEITLLITSYGELSFKGWPLSGRGSNRNSQHVLSAIGPTWFYFFCQNHLQCCLNLHVVLLLISSRIYLDWDTNRESLGSSSKSTIVPNIILFVLSKCKRFVLLFFFLYWLNELHIFLLSLFRFYWAFRG